MPLAESIKPGVSSNVSKMAVPGRFVAGPQLIPSTLWKMKDFGVGNSYRAGDVCVDLEGSSMPVSRSWNEAM